mgnify:CR=1 FL=1
MANKNRLIDAYKLEDLVRSNSARYHHVDDVIAAIAGQPTVDAVEVVHGRYVHKGAWHIECSECQHILAHIGESKNYCPNCGAKMDGGNDDG